MIENRQLQQTRRWCELLTLAHFSVALDATQKAVILNYDGSKFADVPARYQAQAAQMLRSGESFTACPVLQPAYRPPLLSSNVSGKTLTSPQQLATQFFAQLSTG